MHPRLLELVREHRSTLIFVNARRLAERLATRLNELHWEGENRAAEAEGTPPEHEELVKAHHGSLSRERRLAIEDDLKSGRLKGLVATSSLELGIDMGAVDLVVQVESPGAVSRGLQRVGRAGHQVGAPSRGKLFPKHRADLLEAAVVVERMQAGQIEETHYPRNPLDVLCQQLVAMCALDEWRLSDMAAVVRGAAPFADLSDELLASVLDLLAGRYPSEEFAELRPRLVWDRVEGVVRGRTGAQRLAVTNPGTIPDRGLFTVTLPDGTRVGELDEEMVYESRPGETFLLGASTWRIEDITFQKVIVTPAPGHPGKMPFWHGDKPGRPLELGRAIGAFTRELRTGTTDPVARLRAGGLDERAATNLVAYLDEQAETTGVVPDDRTIVVERFQDEIGDWRVCVLSPFGAQVHAPWAMALQNRLAERWGMAVELMWSDDGIVIRLPESVDALPDDELLIDPEEIEDLIVSQLPNTAMFASRFRECAARALLLPKRRPDRRTPLWQQRQRSADLLTVAARYPSFPILLEATRECLNDVFDVPALTSVLRDLRARKIRLVSVDSQQASPFAQSLMFGWIAVYMYAGDAPLAERRAAALALDRDLLRDLLGAEELRELIDADVLADLELELQRLVEGRLARDLDELHDQLRLLGPLSVDELGLRAVDGAPVKDWIDQLVVERRAFWVASRARSACAPPRTPAGSGTRSALPSRWVCPPPAPSPSPRRSSTSSRATPAPTGPSSRTTRRPATASASNRSVPRSRRWRATVGWSAGSSDPTAWSASGATVTCCASSAGAPSPRSAGRSSPSTPGCSPGSSRAGTASGSPGGASMRSSTWSHSCRARRSSPPRSTATSSASACPATTPLISMRCAPRATSCGSEQGPSARPTGVCGWRSATRPGCSCPRSKGSSRTSSTACCSTTSSGGERRSGPTSPRPRSRRASRSTTRRCWPRSGTWCGQASSPTTRWPRSVPSSGPPGDAPPAARRRARGPGADLALDD
jgi:Lhr-like helicase